MQKIKPIVFGMLAAGAALVIELVLSDSYFIFSGREIETNYFDRVTLFLFIVVLIEETAKFILIKKIYAEKKSTALNISSAFLVGLGFAAIEFLFVYANQNLTDLYLGALGAIALHLATTGVIGFSILTTKNANNFVALKTIALAFCLHTIYNLLIIYNLPYSLIYAYLLVIFLLLFIFNQKFRSND